MAYSSRYSAALPTAAQLTARGAAQDATKTALDALPFIPEDQRTSTVLSPERLPLADKCIEAAELVPTVMRRSLDLPRLKDRLAVLKELFKRRNAMAQNMARLDGAINALSADVRFDVDNVHEDVQKDKGETADLGPLGDEIHDYYERPGARGPRGETK